MAFFRSCRLLAGACLAASCFTTQVAAQSPAFPDCTGLVYSTEEDFLSIAGEKYDGNPIVSDGDLISFDQASGSTAVCARNAELIPRQLIEIPRSLGLDAVDVIMPEEGWIAFSTELDESFDLFGHGDILFPTGIVIPQEVLIFRFKLRGEYGLDAVHFTGERNRIIEAIKLAGTIGTEKLKAEPDSYLERIRELGVDIWFSLEGTSEAPDAPAILDGDILSAVSGSKVVAQDAVLSNPIPAGIPDRGVDFGVDALTADRKGNREEIRLSTEILYRGRPDPFTDGEVLRIGGAIEIKHQDLVAGLQPRADFLGLDALSFPPPVQVEGMPHIDSLCGRSHSAVDFGPDGLWRQDEATSPPGLDPRRPCGAFIPIDGTLPVNLATPTGDLTRFRITYESLNPAEPPLSGNVETTWRLRVPRFLFGSWHCVWAPASVLTLSTSGGWMDARDFHDALTGNPNGITGNGAGFGCGNGHLHLGVWNTGTLPGDRDDDLMRVRLEWETTGSVSPFVSSGYNIQLDNTAPDSVAVEVRLSDGRTVVQNCGEAPTGQSQFQVWASFNDLHYDNFVLRVEGGDPWVSHIFASPSGDALHRYFEPSDDPVIALKNTDATGTTGTGMVHLRNIDMTELGANFTRCCYSLRLRVDDSAIRHGFAGGVPGGAAPNRSIAGTTFEAGP